jgi:hypothetical protein
MSCCSNKECQCKKPRPDGTESHPIENATTDVAGEIRYFEWENETLIPIVPFEQQVLEKFDEIVNLLKSIKRKL